MTTFDKLNRLAKWRTLLAGWQLGTRAEGDPEADAVRDHREATLLLRAEQSALVGLLISKGIFTAAEFDAALGKEADQLNADLARRFPGVEATEHGLVIDTKRAAPWLRYWKP